MGGLEKLDASVGTVPRSLDGTSLKRGGNKRALSLERQIIEVARNTVDGKALK